MVNGVDVILQAASKFIKEASKLDELKDLANKLNPDPKINRHDYTKRPESRSVEEVAEEVKSGVVDDTWKTGLGYTIELLSKMLDKAKSGKDRESLLRTIGFLRRVKGSV